MRSESPIRRVLLGGVLALVLAGTALLVAIRRASGSPGHGGAPCPDRADALRYVDQVVTTSIGASIFLTGDGIALGRSTEGAECILAMASDFYRRLPPDERSREDLLWSRPSFTREIVGHAWASTVGIPNGNPIDIAFVDHTGAKPTMQGLMWRTPIGLWIDLLGWLAPARGHGACGPAGIVSDAPGHVARG